MPAPVPSSGGRSPSNSLLNIAPAIRNAFWALSSADFEKQTTATLKLESLVRSDEEKGYCANRLLKGLATSKTASRTAFASVLSRLLEVGTLEVTFVLDKVEKALPMKDADLKVDQGIGRAIAFLTVLRNCSADNLETIGVSTLVDPLDDLRKNVSDKRNIVELLCFEAFSLCAQKLDGKIFKKKVLPLVAESLNSFEVATAGSNLNLLYFALQIARFQPKRAPEGVKMLIKEIQEHEKFEKLLTEINQAWVNSPGFHPVVKSLIYAIFNAESEPDDKPAAKLVSGVVAKFLKGSQLDIAFGLHILSAGIEFCSSDPSQIDTLLTVPALSAFVNMCVAKNRTKQCSRATNDLIAAFFVVVRSKLVENPVKVRLLRIFVTRHPNFDRIARMPLIRGLVTADSDCKPPLLREIIGEFPKFAEKPTSVSKVTGILKIMLHLNPTPGSEEQLVLLKFFAALALLNGAVDLSESSRIVIPDWISDRTNLSTAHDPGRSVRAAAMGKMDEFCEQFCQMKLMHGNARVGISSENFATIVSFLRWLKKRKALQENLPENLREPWQALYKWLAEFSFENAAGIEKGLAVVAIYLMLGVLKSPGDLGSHLEEVLPIRDKFSQQTLRESQDICLDFMLSLLSLPHRLLRVPFQVAFHYICDTAEIDFDVLKPLFDALDVSTPENELMQSSEEVGEDFEPISAEEMSKIEVLETGGESSENEVESSEEEIDHENPELNAEENSDEEEGDGEINPEFRNKLKRALQIGDNSDDQDDLPDFDDEAMFRLDETIGEIFRENIKNRGGSKEKKRTQEEIRAFRSRVCDLLQVFVYSNAPLKLRVGLHPKMIGLAQKAAKKKGQEVISRRILEVAQFAVRIKANLDEFSAELDVGEFLTSIFEISTEISHQDLQRVLAEGLILILRILAPQPDDSRGKFVDKIISMLEHYLTDRTFNTGITLFSVAFGRYPEVFFKKIPHLTRFWDADHETVSPPRKTDLTTAITDIFAVPKSGKWLEKEEFAKTWTKFAKHLRKIFMAQLQIIAKENSSENDVNSSEFKPRYFGSLFNLIVAVSKVTSGSEQGRILFDNEMVSKLKEMESKDFWKLEPQSRCNGFVASQNGGKSPEKLAVAVMQRFGQGQAQGKKQKNRKRKNSGTEPKVNGDVKKVKKEENSEVKLENAKENEDSDSE